MSTFFAGLDWASQTHAVCILDAQGTAHERFDVAHDAAGLTGRTDRAVPPPCGRRLAAAGHRAPLGPDRRYARLGPKRLTAFCAQLAAEAGVVPVTDQSGKARAVTFRWACNHCLRAALTCLADNSRHASTWGRRHLHPRQSTRLQSSPRHSHPRPRLGTRALARLERSKTL